MTSLLLKLIAITTMLCDHLSYALPRRIPLLNAIGRIAFPIFAFLIVQGYSHTKNLKQYFIRLGIFALISQIPFILLLKMAGVAEFRLNIYITLILGLLSISLYDKVRPKFMGTILAFTITLLGDIIRCDYGSWGVLLILLMHILYKYKGQGGEKSIYILSFTSIFAFMVLFMYSFSLNQPLHYTGYAIALAVILLYNGLPARNIKLFKKMKFVFYAFYPVHLVLLYLIHLVITR